MESRSLCQSKQHLYLENVVCYQGTVKGQVWVCGRDRIWEGGCESKRQIGPSSLRSWPLVGEQSVASAEF